MAMLRLEPQRGQGQMSRIDDHRPCSPSTGPTKLAYVLIAANVVTVMEEQAAEAPVPPVVAAVLLAVVAGLLLRSDRRGVLIGAISVQAFLIVFYFVVAVERVPAFEAWGVGLKLAQGVVLVLLTWLLLTQAASDGKQSWDAPAEPHSTVSSDAG
jgi:hypothetical protein